MRMKGEKLSGEMLRLERFIGSWTGKDNISGSLWSRPDFARAKIENRVGLSGRFLLQDYVQKCGGMVRYQWQSVIGWNASAGCYSMHLFDSAGYSSDPPMQGAFAGGRLSFSHHGRNGYVRMVHQILKNGKYKLIIDVSPDNQTWFRSLSNTYIKLKLR